MLLPRRSRARRPGHRAAAALSDRPRARTGRLVAAGRGARAAQDVARHRRSGDVIMAPQANPDTARPADEIVDVLIVGAGGFRAPAAGWLGGTRAKNPCPRQGG